MFLSITTEALFYLFKRFIKFQSNFILKVRISNNLSRLDQNSEKTKILFEQNVTDRNKHNFAIFATLIK